MFGKRVSMMFILLVLLLLVVVPVAAQDPTTEATIEVVPVDVEAPVVIVDAAPAQEATVEAVPNESQSPVVVVQPESQNWEDVLTLSYPVLAALFGVLAGGGTVFAVMSRANQSRPLKDSTEKLLFDSTPPETINKLHQLAMLIKGGASFLENVTDGDENVSSVEIELDDEDDVEEMHQVAMEAIKQHKALKTASNPF